MRTGLTLFAVFAGVTIGLNLLLEKVFHYTLYDSLKHQLAMPGYGAVLIVFLILALDIVLPVPSSLVMIVSGALFGTLSGAVLALAGSLTGNWLGYEMARRFGWEFLQKREKPADLARMSAVLRRYGPAAIILSRPVPVMTETVSLLSGAMRVDRAVFIGASLAGTVPICFIYAYAGSASWEGSTLIPALAAAVVLPAIGWVILSRRTRANP
jgi:uncharacterized membrane protein YdjX (TVP38/TMEM64 family)